MSIKIHEWRFNLIAERLLIFDFFELSARGSRQFHGVTSEIKEVVRLYQTFVGNTAFRPRDSQNKRRETDVH